MQLIMMLIVVKKVVKKDESDPKEVKAENTKITKTSKAISIHKTVKKTSPYKTQAQAMQRLETE